MCTIFIIYAEIRSRKSLTWNKAQAYNKSEWVLQALSFYSTNKTEHVSTYETCKDIHYFHEDWEIMRFNACSSMKPNGSKSENGKKIRLLLITVFLSSLLLWWKHYSHYPWCDFIKNFSQVSIFPMTSFLNRFVVKVPWVDNWEHRVQYFRNKVLLYTGLTVRSHQPREGHKWN